MNFKNKTYLILGGTSGIGFAIAEKITASEGNVVIVSHNSDKLNKAKQILSVGNNHFINYDLSDSNNIYEIFEYCKKNEIVLDGMVYSAGVSPLCLVKDNSVELMESVFRINFFSFIECVKFYQKEDFSREGSKIIVISSITSKGAGYRQVLYGSSKAAINSAVKLMAKELLNRKITVNAVLPGVVKTEMFEKLKLQSENLEERIINSQPLGIIMPVEIAEFVAGLLTDVSNGMTGQEIVYDAGAMLK